MQELRRNKLVVFKVTSLERQLVERAAELADPNPRGRLSRYLRGVVLDASRRRVRAAGQDTVSEGR